MPISEVVTPAPSRGFATVAALKGRIDTGTTPNEILQQDIDAWSLRLEALIGRTLALERVKQTDYGRALGIILLERRPVIEVHSVTISDVLLDEDRWSVDGAGGGLLRIENSHDVRAYLMGDSTPGLAHNLQDVRYVTEYEGGYVLPGWDAETFGPQTLPVDLELAVIEAVALRFGAASMAAAGIKSERLGDWSASYSDTISMTGAPASFAAVAAQYRSVF